VVSTNDWGDCEILPDLLGQIEGDIEQVSADGAYDTSDCYDTIIALRILFRTHRLIKPSPQKEAILQTS
jgi:hypothetical protein